jgi:hypothetical protein
MFLLRDECGSNEQENKTPKIVWNYKKGKNKRETKERPVAAAMCRIREENRKQEHC